VELKDHIEYQYVKKGFGDVDSKVIKPWIAEVIRLENKEPGQLLYIFCDDDYLLNLNKKFLGHDTLTDVISFDYSEEMGDISGDIFISVNRVRENAVELGVSFHEELYRVMIHGVLHLLGYTDNDAIGRNQMREKENYYLSLLP
jgi:probable rRNA maturation factor